MRKAFVIVAVFIIASCSKKAETTISVSTPATDSTNLLTTNWFVETNVEGGLTLSFVLKDTLVELLTPDSKVARYEVDPFDSLGKATASVFKANKTFLSDKGFINISSLKNGNVSGIYSFESKDLKTGELMSNHGSFTDLPIKDNTKVIVKINTMDTIFFDRAIFGYEVHPKDKQLIIEDKGLFFSQNPREMGSMRENRTFIVNTKMYAMLSGLMPDTKYFVCPFAKIKDSIIWGRMSSFVTPKRKPIPPPSSVRPFLKKDTLSENLFWKKNPVYRRKN